MNSCRASAPLRAVALAALAAFGSFGAGCTGNVSGPAGMDADGGLTQASTGGDGSPGASRAGHDAGDAVQPGTGNDDGRGDDVAGDVTGGATGNLERGSGAGDHPDGAGASTPNEPHATASAGDGRGAGGGGALYGSPYAGGQFHLGPVDFQESQWHNACAPGNGYASSIQQVEGALLAGLWNGIPNVAGDCDACIAVTTAKGKSAVLRVVTYGDTTRNSIDVSPAAYALLDSGEFPRSMTWQFTECPDTGKVVYEFQTGSSEYWTSLWVRNARKPITKVEVKSANHASFVALQRGGDGTLTDGAGFGKGSFTVRLTGMDGSQVTDTFAWPSAGVAGTSLTGAGNF